MTTVRKKKPKPYYIDNEKFLIELTDFKKKFEENKAKGLGRPPISNYLGECFMKIAEGFASRRSFNRYLFRDEMVADGVFFCIKYLHNFDPSKVKRPTDPFNYFTMFIYHAFLQRIQREKKYLYVKLKSIQKSEMLGETFDSQGTADNNVSVDIDYSENARIKMNEFLAEFEEKNFPTKKKKTS